MINRDPRGVKNKASNRRIFKAVLYHMRTGAYLGEIYPTAMPSEKQFIGGNASGWRTAAGTSLSKNSASIER